MEYLIVLLSDDSSTSLRACRNGVQVLPRFAFIDLQEPLRDVLDVIKRGSDWKARNGDKETRRIVMNADDGRE